MIDKISIKKVIFHINILKILIYLNTLDNDKDTKKFKEPNYVFFLIFKKRFFFKSTLFFKYNIIIIAFLRILFN